MQAELEKWIEENTCVPLSREMIPVECVRALLKGKVLCDAEPVGLYHPQSGDLCPIEAFYGDAKEVGYVLVYAPASLTGNADISPQGEAGKEGGE